MTTSFNGAAVRGRRKSHGVEIDREESRMLQWGRRPRTAEMRRARALH